MTSALPPTSGADGRIDKIEAGLDVDWLLHAKKDPASQAKGQRPKPTPQPAAPVASSPPQQTKSIPEPAPQKRDSEVGPTERVPEIPSTPQTNGSNQTSPSATKASVSQKTTPVVSKSPPQDDSKSKTGSGNKKDSKRPSWFSSLGHKLSSTSSNTSRSASIDSNSSRKSPQPSPRFEGGNPFADKNGTQEPKQEQKVLVHTPTRRPSVLVAAGTETKLDGQTSFLSSALRRFSSSNTTQLTKGAGGYGAIFPRKVMNVDQNRARVRLPDFDQSKLRRVAFKVDVEIAGIAAQAEEQYDPQNTAGMAPNFSIAEEAKDAKLARNKDRSEGAALKKTASRDQPANDVPKEPEPPSSTPDDQEEEIKRDVEEQVAASAKKDDSATTTDTAGQGTTRKKEKKKRSEAERKERKERKRRHAEANGLVPLELTRDDDDSDSSPSNTPPGASTPRRGQPTTDPLRIYKRCCQLRETTALPVLKEQISKPSAALAEAPGIVGSLDISGNEFSLQDIQTLGDWLAVVPVRSLILDDCNLSDEGLRIILSGLASCKSQEQARQNRKLPSRGSGKSGQEQLGVIEKLSLKHNSNITEIGWKHIALFLHINRSLRAIDLTGIAFPATAPADLSRTSTNSVGSNESAPAKPDLGTLFAKALSKRFGDKLDELILNGCGLSGVAVSQVIDSAITCRIKRLGLANNQLDSDSIPHIERYVTSGVCDGMDLGGNDLRGCGHRLTQVLDEKNPLFALSLTDCNLSVDDLTSTLQHLARLRNFKFLDISRNHDLCTVAKDAIPVLRRYMPKMTALKRIHLSDLDMNTSQLIAIAEILPDCPTLTHVSVLENSKLVQCMNSQQGEDQEEACAVFVSLMTAVRTSKTLIAVEIEVPGHDSSEIVKALASQVVAYSLRNFERTTLTEVGVQSDLMPEKLDKQAPEILLHLVGHMDGYSENHDNDEPAPDDDYVLASSGIVKALSICLGNKDNRLHSRNISPSASGTATPRSDHLRPSNQKKPKDVSVELCESARKIRLRLRPAMIKEDRAGNTDAYRRLVLLDQTLERIIKRFEDEYPETKPDNPPELTDSRTSSYLDATPRPQDSTTDPLDRVGSINSLEDEDADRDSRVDPYTLKLSRTSSNTSLAARNLTQEEGRIHRFGQSVRREVLRPTGIDDYLHGTSTSDDPESEPLASLRAQLEQYKGEDLRQLIEREGADNVIKQLGLGVQELRTLMQDDPEGFEMFKQGQLAAQINAGMIPKSEQDVELAHKDAHREIYGGSVGGSTHQAVTE